MIGDIRLTSAGPRTRAPLGQKTTNAKAKAFQTPGPAPPDTDLGKSKQRSASARKPKPRISHAEPVKLDILADNEEEEEMEIEYMPPPVKDLPDLPDDGIDNVNLSMFEGNHTKGCLSHYMSVPDVDGLSTFDRMRIEQQAGWDKSEALEQARFDRDMDMVNLAGCLHLPECMAEECKDEPERKRKVEAEYQIKVVAIIKEYEAKLGLKPQPERPTANSETKPVSRLSVPKRTTTKPQPTAAKPATTKTKVPTSIASAQRKPSVRINPNPKLHATAVRASNTTLGYSKGRAVSASRKTVVPSKNAHIADKKDKAPENLSPSAYMKRHGTPPVGSDLWMRFRSYGYFGEREKPEKLEDDWSKQLEDMILEDGLQEFQLTI